MKTACFLSPHLDDAVFSAGLVMSTLVAAGWRVRLVTAFTQSVPRPTGFALSCQTDKGLATDVDYLAIRRAEDLRAAACLGVSPLDVHWLGLPEAPHRGYASATDLFGGVHADDADTHARVGTAAAAFLGDADAVFTAAGIGHHVDHLHVRRAAERWASSHGRPLTLWHDVPYVLRLPEPPPHNFEVPPTPPHVGRKLDACAAYATQLGFQFGGEPAMRRRLSGVVERYAGDAWPAMI